MPVSSIPIVSFISGVWSPRLFGRIDISKYATACKTIHNMIVWPHGGVTRRPGFEYIGDAKTGKVKLLPFEYNIEQTYIVEASAGKLRFFRDGGQVGPSENYEIDSPYLESELDQIGIAQTADIMYLVHHNHAPRKLTRVGPDTFALTEVAITNKPAEWSAGNWPSIVTFYQQRLVYTGCPANPQQIWFSKSSSYDDFSAKTNGNIYDDNAVTFTLASDQSNAIKWALSTKEVIVGTSGGEWVIGAQGDTLTPTNLRAQRQSKNGSRFHQPLLIGNNAIYLSRDKKKIREMQYSLDQDSYISPELSLLAEHIARKKIKEITHLPSPDSIIWVLLEDGTLGAITYLKHQEVVAWHTHSTDGVIKSICVIEDDEDAQLWLAIERNGKTFIERMATQYEGSNSLDMGCFYVDSGMSLNSEVDVQTISGLSHLEGKEVSILADGAVHPKLKVINGAITLSKKVKRVHVGLPFKWELTPLSIEGGSPSGISQGKRKRLTSLTIKLEASLGIKYKTRNSTDYELQTRTSSEVLDAAPKLFTGDVEVPLPGGWEKEGSFTLFGEDPLPVKILMLIPRVQANE